MSERQTRDADEGKDVFETALPYVGAATGAVLGVLGGRKVANKVVQLELKRRLRSGPPRGLGWDPYRHWDRVDDGMRDFKEGAKHVGRGAGAGVGTALGYFAAGGDAKAKERRKK